MTGTKAKEAANQFSLGWFSEVLQFLDCGIQDRRFAGASMLEAPDANTNRARNPPSFPLGAQKEFD